MVARSRSFRNPDDGQFLIAVAAIPVEMAVVGDDPESLARNWARFMNWVLAVDGSGFIFWKHCVGLVVERRECLGWKETAAMVFLS